MEADGDAFVTVLSTRRVVVRARAAVIEIRERAGSADDWTTLRMLIFAVAGFAGLAKGPEWVVVVIIAPLATVFGLLGSWMLVRRLLWPAVQLDCVAWTVQGAGVPLRRYLGRPPIVHTVASSHRSFDTGVALSVGNRSTHVVGRIAESEAIEIARTLRRLVRERTLSV